MRASDPGGASAAARGRAPWTTIAAITAIGVALRGLLLALALPVEIQADESNYLYLALGLERFGVYLDQHRYLWPPGYPWLMSVMLGDGSDASMTGLRALQVALSSLIGATTMLFAWRLFSTRAAVAAGLLWAVHLPLAAYTHLLWNETVFLALFLPALWQVLRALDLTAEGSEGPAQRRVLVAGVLLGLSLYVKELPLFLVPPLALVVGLRARPLGMGAAWRLGTLLPLAAVVVVLPWTARNLEVYGRVVPSGATLGENVFQGLNARHSNFDLIPLQIERAKRGEAPIGSDRTLALIAPPEGDEGQPQRGWARPEIEVHLMDRQSTSVRRGLAWSLEHPLWFARTRLKKWSELVTPLSFFTRHHALGHYGTDSALAGPLRRPLVGLSMLTSLVVLLGAVLGGALTLRKGHGHALVSTVVGYLVLTATLVSMSRFRLPIEPLLIVLAAGFLTHGIARRSVPRLVGGALGVAALLGMWWLSWPETYTAAAMALGASS